MSSKVQITYVTDRPREIKQALEALDYAEMLHPDWPMDNIYKCLSILQEEVGELTQAILDYDSGKGSINEIIKEADHAAAMGLRFKKNIWKMIEILNIKRAEAREV